MGPNFEKHMIRGIVTAVAAGLILFIIALSNRVSALEGRVDIIVQMRGEMDRLRENVTKVRADLDAVPSNTEATIVSPTPGSAVDREFSFKIELRNPKEGKYYYLANEIGGLYWPKTRLQPPSDGGVISGQSNEGGTPPDGKFAIAVFEVKQAEHERVLRWFKGSSFPGIQIDGRLLARTELQLK